MEEKLIQRLEAAVARLEAVSGGHATGACRDMDFAFDPDIKAFDDVMSRYVGKVTAAAEKIGGQVLNVSRIIHDAFAAQRELLIIIKQTKKPDVAGLSEFLEPLNEEIAKANRLSEGKRSDDFFNHLKSAADSLSALVWIAYTGKDCGMSMPISHIEESWQMAEFYNNKILVDYKNKDHNHIEWAKAMKELYLPGLRDYVKSFYPLGPAWNPNGKPSSKASGSGSGPAAPPPPASPLFELSQASSSHPKKGLAAVFQEINSSQLVTAGLRKVTYDMKAKNRTDRTGVVGVNEKEARAGSTSVPVSKTGPPKLELQMGRKWVVENHIGNKNLVIDDCDPKQGVYIFGCKDSVLQIKGKVNIITIDKCTKMGIVFTEVVAACEIVNCNGVEVQCQGSAPTVSIDNTAGCQLYLSKDSLGASITTAKSSEINVLVPCSDPDGDWAEHSLPQQFLHTFEDGHFVTCPVSHSGGG